MGASQSTTAVPKTALHVLRVTPGSPASETEIEPYFSFLVGYQGFEQEGTGSLDAVELERIVEAHEGKILNLHVWNHKYRELKVVPIRPSRLWAQGPDDPSDPNVKPSLLGLSLRLCEPEFAMDNVWHVLDVAEGGPAESAGLVPAGDWVLGWSGGVLSGEDDFYRLVEAHVDKPLRIYVYSSDFDAIREVVLIPNRHWGGEGLLGCVFGFGLLHRIPVRQREQDEQGPPVPPELLEDGEPEQELFIPAETLDSTMPYSPQTQTHQRHSSITQMTTSASSKHHPILDELEEVVSRTSPSPRPGGIQTPIPKRASASPASPLSSSPSLRGTFGNGMGRVFTPPARQHGSSTPTHAHAMDDDGRSEGSLTSVD